MGFMLLLSYFLILFLLVVYRLMKKKVKLIGNINKKNLQINNMLLELNY